MSTNLTSAVASTVVTADMDFNTVLGMFTAGRITPEQFSQYQASREAAAAGAKPAKVATKKAVNTGLTRAAFRTEAKPVTLTINGVTYTAEVKEFSTGSLGWNLNGKVTMKVGDTVVTCQCGLNMTIVGSKELPQA